MEKRIKNLGTYTKSGKCFINIDKKNKIFDSISRYEYNAFQYNLFKSQSKLGNNFNISIDRTFKEYDVLQFEKLKKIRNCICVDEAVSNFEGETSFTYIDGYEEGNYLSGITSAFHNKHLNRIKREVDEFGGEIKEIKVPVRKVQSILDEHGVTDIDFCSIDTEGSEFEIVKSIDFKKTNIKVLIIENSFHKTKLVDYLKKKGYDLHNRLEWDDIYVKRPKKKFKFWPF